MSEKRDPLKDYAKSRTKTVLARIHTAKSVIELDIEQNEGVYPYNGGRLSAAELCRRAGVHEVTLHGPTHKSTTLRSVHTWLKEVSLRLITGKRVVRQRVTERADYWHQRFKASSDWVHRYHIEQAKQIELLTTAHARIKELETEVLLLKKQFVGGKVVPINRVK
ncbi:hypothetical protein [Nevskia sp.]|uniref:hypothetical protein n=1 Tax=Nevskia sp. TaxID=1929292 RepID=UPI0025D1CB97|nr:hypothetical protein [Nevskia sp.]